MNNPTITAAKMICKSVDALTREIFLLRKELKETELCADRKMDERKISGLGLQNIPPTSDGPSVDGSTGCG